MTTPDQSGNDETPLPGAVAESDHTPDVPAVMEVHHDRPSLNPGSLYLRTGRLAAIAVIIGASVAVVLEKAVKTPRTPYVMNGGPGDGGASGGAGGTGGAGGADTASCNVDPTQMYPDPQQIFGIDDVHVKAGTPDTEFPCDFDTVGSEETVVGTEFVDGDKIRHCFFSRVWAEGAAMRLAGTVKANKKTPGQIKLVDGLLDVVVGVDTNDNKILDPEELAEKRVTVQGEASIAITTTGRVSITRMPPVNGAESNEVLVVAVQGQALIYQEGRDDAIILEECDKIRVPLNKQASQGCYIAEDMGKNGSSSHGGAVMLAAGALFLAIRRKAKKA
jgi:hypothetical protein